MTRFLLKLSLILMSTFAVFNVAARALGTLQPPNPALAGFTEGCEGKPQPCWYGLVPGETKAETARNILTNLGYVMDRRYGNFLREEWAICEVDVLGMETELMALELKFCGKVQAGDILAMLPTESWHISIDCFENFQIAIGGNWWLTVEKTNPHSTIVNLYISWPTGRFSESNWQGFSFTWLYKNQQDLWPTICGF